MAAPRKATASTDKPPTAARAARTAAAAAKPPRGEGRPASDTKLAESIAGLYVTAAVLGSPLMTAAGMSPELAQYASLRIASEAHDLAAAWVELANANPAVKRALTKATSGGGVVTVVSAHLALAVSIGTAAKTFGTYGKSPEQLAEMIAQGQTPEPLDQAAKA